MFNILSTHRAASLLLLLAAGLFLIAVAVAGGAPRAGETEPASASPSMLQPRALQRDMRAFARRTRAARERALVRAGVVPVRGPVDYGTETNRFGAGRGGHVHNGQDMFAPTGTPLVAVRNAVVLETGSDGGRGNYLLLHAQRPGRTFSYFHMAAPARLRPGRRVRAGERVGAVGCSGSCNGAHLHFEVHRGRGARGAGVDPLPLLRRWGRSARR